jgi:hypothetical protein
VNGAAWILRNMMSIGMASDSQKVKGVKNLTGIFQSQQGNVNCLHVQLALLHGLILFATSSAVIWLQVLQR